MSTSTTTTKVDKEAKIDVTGTLVSSPRAIELANQLLQKNHDDWHMFFRDKAGHNHIAHSILTCLALGAEEQDIQRAYDDGVGIQRPIPEVDNELVEALKDDKTLYDTIGTITQYKTFLVFFQEQIRKNGYEAVVNRYCFSRTPLADKMLARMYEGAYHPIIHLGLGIEFRQPAIVAEALAQAAAHDDSNIATLFRNAEEQAGIAYPPKTPKTMIELIQETRNNGTIFNAPVWEDFGNKMRDGIVGRAGSDMAAIAAQFQVKCDEEELRRRTAEMTSTCAYFAGASQRPGRKRKIDFFYMHCVTSSIFFSVLAKQDWIKLEDRVRLVEWKARLDLAWYAVSGCAELFPEAITEYSGDFSGSMGWDEILKEVKSEHDDGHVAKLVRALHNGELVSRPFAEGEHASAFPVKGDMWLKLARMTLDTTRNWPTDLKWVNFTGFEMGWKIRPDLA